MASSSKPQGPKETPWPSTVIDASTHGAIAFCQIYYETYDEPTRRAVELPKLYLPTAKIVWNGNAVSAEGLPAFLASIPLSRHDLQTLDCHPTEGIDPSNPAPDLIVTVMGSVLHGPSVMQHPDSTNRELPPQDHPRKFHEVFVLRAAEATEGGQPKYAIHSSAFRFIG